MSYTKLLKSVEFLQSYFKNNKGDQGGIRL